jgi:hypothetical protein
MHKYRDDSYINQLVDDYKDSLDKGKNSEDLRSQILESFNPYFKKYCFMLCSRQPVDFSNNDTIKFLRLFMAPTEREPLESFLLAARKLIPYLRSIFQDYTYDDLFDQMVCFFLEQLNRYHPMITKNKTVKERISFSHFIQVNLRFKIAKLVQDRAKDALATFHNIEFDERIQKSINPEACLNWNVLDLRWVVGDTASDHFRELDDIERYILYLRYENEGKRPMSDRDIAKMTGMDRMFVRRRIAKIKSKLKSLITV